MENGPSNNGGNGNGSGNAPAGGNGGGANNGGAGSSPASGAPNAGGSNNSSATTFDPASLTPEQLNQVLEKNPEIWKAPRLAELREKGKKYDDAQTAAQAAEAKRLEEEGKFKELAENQKSENQKLRDQLKNSNINNALTAKLAGMGVVDIDAALKLIDRQGIDIGEDGTVSGVDEALKALKEGKSYLFNANGSSNPTVGSATNGNSNSAGGNANAPTFKRSQLQDPVFYKANREKILEAQRAGTIEDDLSH
jgi:hypothetical protein